MVKGIDGHGPPEADKRKKKYHRRSPWACDECRLRKRKCDGTKPCAGCKEIGNACTYEFRRPARTPTHRIRNLEDHLRLAQDFIKDLQKKLPSTNGVHFDGILQTLDFTAPDQSPPAEDKEKNKPKLASMMTGFNQMIVDRPWSTSFYGSSSGFAFVMRTLEMFQRDNKLDGKNSRVVAELFDQPLPTMDAPAVLPPQDLAFELLDTVFGRCTFIQFLQEQEIRELTKAAYEAKDPGLNRFLPLLHVVLALGYLFNTKYHQVHGCDAAAHEATKLFLVARASIDLECKDILSLQVVIACIVFLHSTCRIAAAHSLIGLACSAVMRLGLHSGYSVGNSVADETRAMSLAAVLNYDIYTSLVLGLPPFLRIQDIDNRLHTVLATDDKGREACARHMDLMRLITLSQESIFNQQVDINSSELATVEKSLQQWAKDAFPLLASLGEDLVSTALKHELETTYLFAQIILYRPFLHYLRGMADGEAIPISLSQHALACLKIASTTILRSEKVMKKGALCPASWKCIYTLFLSVMCLIFLIAAHNGTSQPSEAWRKAAIGIRVLASCRCTNDGASACLKILKMVIRQLKHTVDFDIEQIEATTQRFCQLGGEDELTPDESILTPAMPIVREKLSLAHILQTPEELIVERVNDADETLKRAEMMEMDFGFDDLMKTDEF